MSSHKERTIFTVIFLFLLIKTSCWDYNLNGADWPDTCKLGDQAPIDVSPPFTYQPFPLKFNYEEMNTEYLLYHDSNNLILEGDFGYIEYDNKIYSSSHIQFFSPSLHSFKSKKFPLEMQVIHQDENGDKITMCILFKESVDDYSLILGKLGFDDEQMSNLDPLLKKTIKERINIGKYISKDKDFFSYDAFEPVPPCDRKNTYYILTDILNVNKNQIAHFPIMVQNKFRSPQPRLNRNIFITIPLNQFQQKIEENRKILQENEMRLKKNEKLDQVGEAHSEDANVSEPKSKNKDCDEIGVVVPFEQVKQKVLAKEKYNKKTDVKLLTAKGINMNQKPSMIIDKDIPKTEGEIKRDVLKDKYLKWRELYNNLIEGEKVQDEKAKKIMLFQMKMLERELKDNNYLPYMNFITRVNSYQSSFIELPSEENKESHKLKERYKNKGNKQEILSSILSSQIKQEDLISPYTMKRSSENETLYSQGRKAKSEIDDITANIFDTTSWPIDCKRASFLSPINIDVSKNLPLEPQLLKFNLTSPKGKLYVNNDDYKIVVFSEGGFGQIQYYDHIYNAKRIALHLPSEHTLSSDEERSSFEMQIICYDDYENVAAVSVLFDLGGSSFEFLNMIGFGNSNNYLFSKKIRNNERVEIENTEYVSKGMDLSYLFNTNPKNKFVSYVGTTTTPPCKTNVRWFVSLNKGSITKEQLDMFPVLYGRFRNIRGTQQLNGRQIKVIG